jgi:hypothetical protein
MRKIISALSLAAALVPSLAHAQPLSAKVLKAEIKQNVLKIDPGLKINARKILTVAFDGPSGGFSFDARKAGSKAVFKVSGSWDASQGSATVSGVKVISTQFQHFGK